MSWIDRLLGREASASDSTELAEVSATDAPAPFLSKRGLASLQPVAFGVMAQGTAQRRPP